MIDKFIADLGTEIENLKARRVLAIETARRVLDGAYGERHRGHNLGNEANEISELSAKIEQTEMILADLSLRVQFSSK